MQTLDRNHPTVIASRDHWHKIAAMILKKTGASEVLITAQDILDISGTAVVLQETSEGLRVVLLDASAATLMAAMPGAAGGH